MPEEERNVLTPESKCCLRMWAEYLTRAVNGEFLVDPSIKDSDFFDELLGLFGADRKSFDSALKKKEANPLNKVFIAHRKRLAKYGTSSNRDREDAALKERFRYQEKHPPFPRTQGKEAA